MAKTKAHRFSPRDDFYISISEEASSNEDEALVRQLATSSPEFKNADQSSEESTDDLPQETDEESTEQAEKGKGRARELHLFDLPLEIISMVVCELDSASDLSCLARSHSFLHTIIIPYMYSGLQFTWARSSSPSLLPGRKYKEVLARGLTSLAGSPSHIGGKPVKYGRSKHRDTSFNSQASHQHHASIGNYARFTKDFCISNGEPHQVAKYSIATDNGRMLGTLAALALSRMINLQTFTWDMPTGIVRGVWRALANLGSETIQAGTARHPLRSVWVRLPNCEEASRRWPHRRRFPRQTANWSAHLRLLHRPVPHSERPNFSVLSNLSSISVLSIDQVTYLEELSILIRKSVTQLCTVRISLTPSLCVESQELCKEEHNVVHEFLSEPGMAALRANGVIGLLMSKIGDCDGRGNTTRGSESQSIGNDVHGLEATQQKDLELSANSAGKQNVHITALSGDNVGSLASTSSSERFRLSCYSPHPSVLGTLMNKNQNHEKETQELSISSEATSKFDERDDGRLIAPVSQSRQQLKLEVLAFENVPLSVPVLMRAVDWRFLTDITILRCKSAEQLWEAFNESYFAQNEINSSTSTEEGFPTAQYPLRLRKVWTDALSNALISFLSDHVASNSLECLLLGAPSESDCRRDVSIHSLCHGLIQHHCSSLRKLSVANYGIDREIVTYITSGKMPRLQELALGINVYDWNFLLNRLSRLPHLRALYVTNSLGAQHLGKMNHSSVMALQVLDYVSSHPDLRLCHFGHMRRFYRIFERKNASLMLFAESSYLSLPEWTGPRRENIVEVTPDSAYYQPDSESWDSDDSETDENSIDLGITRTSFGIAHRVHINAFDHPSNYKCEPGSSRDNEVSARRPNLGLRELKNLPKQVEIFRVLRGFM